MLPPLKFEFGTSTDRNVYMVKPSSYLIEEEAISGLRSCHVTVIGQEYSNLDHWILGEAFM